MTSISRLQLMQIASARDATQPIIGHRPHTHTRCMQETTEKNTTTNLMSAASMLHHVNAFNADRWQLRISELPVWLTFQLLWKISFGQKFYWTIFYLLFQLLTAGVTISGLENAGPKC